jgi:hypothetical protein
MKEIKLTQGKVALVDDEDFDRVNQFKWYAVKMSDHRYYATRMFGHGMDRKRLYMQHFIIGTPSKGFVIDHINNQGLDNQRVNLRVVTQRENSVNWDRPRKSKYFGVTWDKQHNKWKARARRNGETEKFLGYFKDEEEAHNAYINFTGCSI